MTEPRLDQIFREETRRALGTDRMTTERLIDTIADFVASATPDEVAALGRFLRGLAAIPLAAPGPTPLEAAKEAVSKVSAAMEAFRKERTVHVAPGSPIDGPTATAPSALETPQAAQRGRHVGPFRIPYPAPISRPVPVAPEPPQAPEPDQPLDDIEDFTPAATGS